MSEKPFDYTEYDYSHMYSIALIRQHALNVLLYLQDGEGVNSKEHAIQEMKYIIHLLTEEEVSDYRCFECPKRKGVIEDDEKEN